MTTTVKEEKEEEEEDEEEGGGWRGALGDLFDKDILIFFIGMMLGRSVGR